MDLKRACGNLKVISMLKDLFQSFKRSHSEQLVWLGIRRLSPGRGQCQERLARNRRSVHAGAWLWAPTCKHECASLAPNLLFKQGWHTETLLSPVSYLLFCICFCVLPRLASDYSCCPPASDPSLSWLCTCLLFWSFCCPPDSDQACSSDPAPTSALFQYTCLCMTRFAWPS